VDEDAQTSAELVAALLELEESAAVDAALLAHSEAVAEMAILAVLRGPELPS
jgi:hypothetical protein